MIIACGKMVVRPDAIGVFRTLLPEQLALCNAEEGCHFFSMAIENEATGNVVVCEIWESDQALKDHFGKPFVRAFIEKLGDAILEIDSKIYEVAGVRPNWPLDGGA
jgi:quinol monooxygenase YgiN